MSNPESLTIDEMDGRYYRRKISKLTAALKRVVRQRDEARREAALADRWAKVGAGINPYKQDDKP